MYVGKSTNFKQREKNWHNKNWYYANQLLTDDRKKYGLDNFESIILQEVDNFELDRWEKHYIKMFNTIYPNGYNDNEGGSIGFHHSQRTKDKISKSNKGKIISEEQRLKIGKPIIEIDKDGIVTEWEYAAKCANAKGYSRKNISAVCHGLKKTHLGSKFYFKSDYERMQELNLVLN